jgi:hypothetical protein
MICRVRHPGFNPHQKKLFLVYPIHGLACGVVYPGFTTQGWIRRVLPWWLVVIKKKILAV